MSHDFPECRTAALDQGRRRSHVHHIQQLPNLVQHVDANCLIDRDEHVIVGNGVEAGLFDLDSIMGRLEKGRRILTALKARGVYSALVTNFESR